MPVIVQYGGDSLRYPLHRAACQGDDAGLERLLHALRSGTPVPIRELEGAKTGCAILPFCQRCGVCAGM